MQGGVFNRIADYPIIAKWKSSDGCFFRALIFKH
jgi:hypothetical protein